MKKSKSLIKKIIFALLSCFLCALIMQFRNKGKEQETEPDHYIGVDRNGPLANLGARDIFIENNDPIEFVGMNHFLEKEKHRY